MKRTPKTQAETRRANRGNVPGVLGMAELAMLGGIRDKCRLCDGSPSAVCTRKECPQALVRS